MRLVAIRGPVPEQMFPLQEGENSAGRSSSNPIHLPSTAVSSRHCVFVVHGQRLTVKDLGSTNGVFVEGRKVTEAALQHGNRVQVGDWLLSVDAPETLPAPAVDPDRGRPTLPGEDLETPGPDIQAPAPPDRGAVQGFGAPAAVGGFGANGGTTPGFGVASSPDPGGASQPAPVTPAGGAFGAPERTATDAGPIPSQSGFPQPVAPSSAPGSNPGFGVPTDAGQAWGGFGGQPGGGFGAGPADGAAPAGFGAMPGSTVIPPTGTASDMEVGKPEDWLSALKYMWRRTRRFPWKMQLAAILLATSFFLLLAPVGGSLALLLRASNIAEEQALARGKALALALAARNLAAITEQNNLKLDANFILGEMGVKVAMITDSRGVVRAPPEKGRQSIAGKAYFQEASNLGTTVVWEKGGGEWYILAPIRVQVVDGAPATIAGWAFLLFDVDSVAGDAAPIGGRLLLSAIVLFMGLAVAGLAIWWLVSKPVGMVREELELALRGHVSEVKAPMEWDQLRELTHSINRLLTRWQRSDGSTGGAGLDPLVLGALLNSLSTPVFLLDTQGRVLAVSQVACDWLAVQRESLLQKSISTILPDPGFLGTLKASYEKVNAPPENLVAETTRLGQNTVRISVVSTDAKNIMALISVG